MDLNAIFGQPRASAARSVNDAIQGAATSTGTSFEYLLATAQAESGMNPQAASPTSSARGLYQFIDQTWLATVKHAGPSLGYGKYADAIVQNPAGHFEVPDAAMRRDVMALRFDPAANAAMAGALTRDNATALAGGLGRKASDGELYIAHVLGPAGALRLTSLAVTNPSTAADTVFPAAAEANRSIFYDRAGHARSVLDVYGALVGRYDGARGPGAAPSSGSAASFNSATGDATAPAAAVSAAAGAPLVIVPNVPTSVPVPGYDAPVAAAASPLPAAEKSGPLFQGLFSDRSAPVSQVVRDLWAPGAAPAADAAAASSAAASAGTGTIRDLFVPPSTAAAGLFRR
jgi:hypothetical protein